MTSHIEKYLNAEEKEQRLDILKKITSEGHYLPVSLCSDLLSMNMDTDEKISILDATSGSDPLVLEHYLTSSFENWPQNLATFALRKWSRETDNLLWYRCLGSIKSSHLSQRIRYTILALCPYVEGQKLLESLVSIQGLSDLSPAFHGLLLKRSIQWNYNHKEIEKIAAQSLEGMMEDTWHIHKASTVALFWYRRFNPEYLKTLIQNPVTPELWRDIIRIIIKSKDPGKETEKSLNKIFSGSKGKIFWDQIRTNWPPLFSRHKLTKEFTSASFKYFFIHRESFPLDQEDIWKWFAGIEGSVIAKAICDTSSEEQFAWSVKLMRGFAGLCSNSQIHDRTEKFLRETENPADFLNALPLRLRISLTRKSSQQKNQLTKRMQLVLSEEEEYQKEKFPSGHQLVNFFQDSEFGSGDHPERILFFNLAYRNIDVNLPPKNPESFWNLLAHNWVNPDPKDLSQLATLARQEPRIFHISYIHTLARFQGQDEAALKLLDYIRTPRKNELQEVIYALGGINTARSSQELVSCITRPNITTALQLEICEILKEKDLTALQSELRSAIDDLDYKASQNEDIREVCEALSALLIADPGDEVSTEARPDNDHSTTSEFLDTSLQQRIEKFQDLSSEVRRALRTAQFFYLQVEGGHTAHSIDLSPVIDMQYKALELIFRETFEDPCFKIINQGILQRKLDVIGYSRPIPKAMEEFENYIGSLPVINEIPYFSKFKLRKMLRAICQFRPGRRFTLDGIKAFALFFLCFGRKKCQYGLAEIVPVNFSDDQALFHFCKILHVFQDFRNRAAHEGFRPEARNDMEGIWDHTSEIIATVYEMKGPLSG